MIILTMEAFFWGDQLEIHRRPWVNKKMATFFFFIPCRPITPTVHFNIALLVMWASFRKKKKTVMPTIEWDKSRP